MTNKDQLVENAARAYIAHGGPECLTDPRDVLATAGQALDAGATLDDIEAAMRQLRKEG